tara:strand:- start:267 stop:464 length:198 start_codon:yes stop_codon:yes gene_type:complete
MDIEKAVVIQRAKDVILTYCEYLLDIRDREALAEDMKSLLLCLPEDVRKEIQMAEFKKGPKGNPR